MRIRYHHLMCIPSFKGEGYSKKFCENLAKIKEAFESGDYSLVDGCDDVCKACPNNICGRCIDERKVSRYDALVKEAIDKNEAFSPKDICTDCKWYYICKEIV